MLLYSRKKVRYRRDGYCWKKRKDGKTTREDHMKLKVQGTEVNNENIFLLNRILTGSLLIKVYLWVLRTFSYLTNISPSLLLASTES